ncbi:PRP16p pre-mRNA splicing family SFII helicase [Cryptosporidium ubiquitum]|uniref:RNA helicase n=1 Tax=Cryptosporidium ubiquitum TaxID=857276 RepID=A0A1J4MI76_9CRYT|nr:PRP16p pre-mRNA splicing family SFII helicase [Cryptosporidium ubiquitum]OII73937.1 PRP16p pre-mRNA splicing family SFII helicase [Cryptosporidium ubiquitum]
MFSDRSNSGGKASGLIRERAEGRKDRYHVYERDWGSERTKQKNYKKEREFYSRSLLDREEERTQLPQDSSQLDRIWYDSYEDGGSASLNDHFAFDSGLLLYGNGGVSELTKYSKEDLQKTGKVQKRRRISQKRIQGNIDNERWELSRLGGSGIGLGIDIMERKDNLFLNDLEFDEKNNKKIHIIVDRTYPAFLKTWEMNTIRSQLEFSRWDQETENDEISIIKDKTSDIAKLARTGSSILKTLRSKENKTKMRQRFWELQDSKIGALISSDKPHSPENSIRLQEEAGEGESGSFKQSFGSLFKRNKDESGNHRNSNESGTDSDLFGDLENNPRQQILKTRQNLPVYKVRDSLLKLIGEHMVVVVVGETGSGKTTQLTQYLHEYGYSRRGIIGCTQPRRVAAVSVAQRVADEMNVDLGEEVGYTIRFEDFTSKSTVIKYMTDGVLMRESLNDPELERYSVIIMDEAHERSLSTDVLFGIFRSVLLNRRDFRLIVTSATMDSEKLSLFFGNAPIFNIPGRTFPVEIEYLRYFPDDYIDAAVRQCLKIHCTNPLGLLSNKDDTNNQKSDGDILIFMTGQEDIEATCVLISEKLDSLMIDGADPLLILPIYSQLPSDLQAKIFKPSPYRKVIVATNIAETSLTLDGIRYVIDCGLCKVKVYNPKIGMDSLQITPISQANASQRSGRAGRVSSGICYRMYTEQTFLVDMLPNSIPEIQRTNLSNVVLLLKSLGSEDVFSFPFIDPPSSSSISTSLYQLWSLGALDDKGSLTDLGRQMARFPLDPPLSKVLLTANKLDCLIEVIVVVAMLTVPSVFYRPKDRVEEADASREKFSVPESDHLTLLNIFIQWKRHGSHVKWSEKHFLHQKALLRVEEVFKQILEIYSNIINIETIPKVDWKPNPMCWDNLRKAFCSGYFHNSAKIRAIGQYVNLSTSVPAYIHPSSSLFLSGVNPDYLVYHEVIITSKEYMNTVSAIEPEWLNFYAPHIFKLNIYDSNKDLISLDNSSQISCKKPNSDEIENVNTITYTETGTMEEAQNSTNLPNPQPELCKKSSSKIKSKKNKHALSFSFGD